MSEFYFREPILRSFTILSQTSKMATWHPSVQSPKYVTVFIAVVGKKTVNEEHNSLHASGYATRNEAKQKLKQYVPTMYKDCAKISEHISKVVDQMRDNETMNDDSIGLAFSVRTSLIKVKHLGSSPVIDTKLDEELIKIFETEGEDVNDDDEEIVGCNH